MNELTPSTSWRERLRDRIHAESIARFRAGTIDSRGLEKAMTRRLRILYAEFIGVLWACIALVIFMAADEDMRWRTQASGLCFLFLVLIWARLARRARWAAARTARELLPRNPRAAR